MLIKLPRRLRALLKHESTGGILLMAVTLLALLCANSPWRGAYQQLWALHADIGVGHIRIAKPLLLWINDGLMTVFFLSVGLEIKREFLRGQLRQPAQMLLPGVAALGGVLVPALIYTACNHGHAAYMPGWAVPTATDIAFALGVLALLGARISPELKTFVMILAVLDDLAAVLIIALFYTDSLSTHSLLLAGFFTLLLCALNRLRVRRIGIYMLIGLALWTCVLRSGVHATLSGVILAMTLPMDAREGRKSPGDTLLQALAPWTAFFIVPLFAFANAGIDLHGLGLHDLLHPVTSGIVLGLFIGKQVGIVGATWVMVRLGWVRLPARNWREFHGAAVVCGIGFTMSLFISSLAFASLGSGVELADRLGILLGSLLSAGLGYVLLRQATTANTFTQRR